MRKLIILLCMVLTVASVSTQTMDIRDPNIGSMLLRDAHPGMVCTDGALTYYVNDVSEDALLVTSVCRVDGRLCLFQVLIWGAGIDSFYQVTGMVSIFGGLRADKYKSREVMYKEAEGGELYSSVMYMPVDVQVNTSSVYPTITYTYELKSGTAESWNTMMVWEMDGTMIYSGIIGEL